MRQAHFTVVGHIDNQSVLEEARNGQLVKRLDHIRVDKLLKVAIKVAGNEEGEKGLDLQELLFYI